MLTTKNDIGCDSDRSQNHNSLRIFIKSLLTLPALFTLCVHAQVNGELRDFSSSSPSNSLNYTIPSVSERDTSGDGGQQIKINDIKVVVKRNEGGGKLAEITAIDSRVVSLISHAISEKSGLFTMGELKTLSDQLGARYRELGYLLSTAYIPEQEVVGGVLTVEVLQGVLGDVTVVGNSEYDTSLFENEFSTLKGDVVQTEEAEEALLLVQKRIVGAQTIGIFGPGSEVGLSNLEIAVANEDTFKAVTFLDNYGSAYTGEFRAGVHLENYNVLGMNDNFIVDIVANQKPSGVTGNGSKCCFGGFKYEIIGEDLSDSFGIEFSRSTYDVGNARFQFSNLGLEGSSEKLRIFASQILKLSRSTQLTLNYGVSSISAESTSTRTRTENQPGTRDEIGEYDLGLDYILFGAGTTFGSLSVHAKPGANGGFANDVLNDVLAVTGYDEDAYIGDNSPNPTRAGTLNGKTLRFVADFNHWYKIGTDFTLKFKAKGQYSHEALAPIQQFGLAGPSGVRFLETGVFLGDTALVSSLEMVYSAERGEWKYSPSVFLDYGFARQNKVRLSLERTIDSRSVNAFGMGIGFEAKYGEALEFALTYAFDVSDMEETDVLAQSSSDEEFDDHIYGSVVYRF